VEEVLYTLADKVNIGTLVSVPVDFSSLGTTTDDGAEVNYTVTGQENFQVHAQVHAGNAGSDLTVNYGQISSIGNPLGSTIDLGFWAFNDEAFILSGSDSSSFSSTNTPQDWMQQNIHSIGCQPLRHLCMPASHDAGMSQLNGHTALADDQDTLTQYFDIGGQLAAGFRYFDIRPVIHDGQFYTGHYSDLAGSWQGGNGQSIASIISEVNAFLATNDELVILDLSHAYDTDNGYPPLSQAQTNALMQQLLGIQHRFAAPAGTSDLSQLKLNDFISSGASVIIIFDDSTLSPGDFSQNAFPGFYNNTQFSVYNSYADTPDVGTMVTDQLGKMAAQRRSPDSGLFLLSWTLTTLDPRDAAPTAHAALFQRLWPALNKQTFPNFIMLDAIGYNDNLNNRNVAALSMAINQYFSPPCPA
jgi:hypothetical protein